MAFQMCEKLQRYTWPLKVEVTSNAPMNWFMAPLLASIGTLGTFAPLSASFARTTSVQYPHRTVNPGAILECGGLPPLLRMQAGPQTIIRLRLATRTISPRIPLGKSPIRLADSALFTSNLFPCPFIFERWYSFHHATQSEVPSRSHRCRHCGHPVRRAWCARRHLRGSL